MKILRNSKTGKNKIHHAVLFMYIYKKNSEYFDMYLSIGPEFQEGAGIKMSGA